MDKEGPKEQEIRRKIETQDYVKIELEKGVYYFDKPISMKGKNVNIRGARTDVTN
jgi:hypothetical protein